MRIALQIFYNAILIINTTYLRKFQLNLLAFKRVRLLNLLCKTTRFSPRVTLLLKEGKMPEKAKSIQNCHSRRLKGWLTFHMPSDTLFPLTPTPFFPKPHPSLQGKFTLGKGRGSFFPTSVGERKGEGLQSWGLLRYPFYGIGEMRPLSFQCKEKNLKGFRTSPESGTHSSALFSL